MIRNVLYMWLSLLIILVTSVDIPMHLTDSNGQYKKFQNRLRMEFDNLSSNPPENCIVSLVDNDLTRWRVDILGPEETPYEGGHFQVSIVFPQNYPFEAPTAKFVTKIYHPDIKKESGEISKGLYQTKWGPLKSARWVIEVILTILYYPSLEYSIEPDILRQIEDNYDQYVATARLWVQLYAR